MIPNNNFDLLENFIPYKIVKNIDDSKFYIMISIFDSEYNNFGKNIYFEIDEKFSKYHIGNEIYEFIINNTDTGISYMSDSVNFETLNDLKIKDIENIDYFIFKNESLSELMFTEEELDLLNQTFMNIIKEYSTKYGNENSVLDSLYRNVINFYANGQYDDAIILMNSIFNSPINVTSSTSQCGCQQQQGSCSSMNSTVSTINTGTDLIQLDNATCMDKYKAAMYQWLIQMLSDTAFYCEWMFIDTENDGIENVPNEGLIDKLINLLKQFLALGYDLSNLKGCTNNCNCGHTKKYRSRSNNTGDCNDLLYDQSGNLSLTNGCTNYSIINNYIKLLEYVKENKVMENKNKIYIYGKQFAEIFPLLTF